jgi:hypothetical protein
LQPLITYMQQLDSGDVLAWAGMLSLFGFGLWAAAQIIIGGVQLYADLAGQRAKERDNG